MVDPTQSGENTTTINVGGLDITLRSKGSLALVPASLKLPNGKPRFHLAFPKELGEVDQGAKYLVFHEAKAGYEPPTRNLLERVLRPGDLFIDVGAHWGFFTLQAATHPAGDITVIAFEPDPTNASILLRNVAQNGLTDKVSIVCAACGGNAELAPLITNSSMGHSVHGLGLKQPNQLRGPAHWVSVVTLDSTLAGFPQSANRRVIIKIDAEGSEASIIDGGKALLESGRVALVVWECGQAFANDPGHNSMQRMINFLNDLGYHHLRPAVHHIDGPLCSFSVTQKYLGNVFSYHPGVLTEFDRLLPIRPDDVAALNERGLLLHQQKRFQDALSVYRQALAVKPNIIEIIYNCGNAMLELKHFDEALANYDKALVIKPDYVSALNNRGCVLQQLGRFDEALESYDKVLAIQPNDVIALNNRGWILQQLRRLDEALASYDKALTIEPKHRSTISNRATLLQELAQTSRGVRPTKSAGTIKTAKKKSVTGRVGRSRRR